MVSCVRVDGVAQWLKRLEHPEWVALDTCSLVVHNYTTITVHNKRCCVGELCNLIGNSAINCIIRQDGKVATGCTGMEQASRYDRYDCEKRLVSVASFICRPTFMFVIFRFRF